MPNIQTFEGPQNLGLQPSETGIDSTQQAARRVGAFYDQAGQDYRQIGQEAGSALKVAGDNAVQQIEHHEKNVGAKNFADLQANIIQQWNDTAKNADPNDPTVAAKFREQVLEPQLNKFADDGFLTEGGKDFAQQHVAALRQHMVEKTSADMSTLAGIAVTTNFNETVNKLASTARLDPSSLDFQLKNAETTIGGIVDSSPTLGAADKAKVSQEGLLKAKEAIVKSAVVGMIEKNPNIDLSAVEKKYGDYITGPEMQMFQKAAKVQAKSDFLQQKQIETYQRQQADEAVHVQANKVFSDNVTIDPVTNRPVIKPEAFKQTLDIARNNPNAPIAGTVTRTLSDWFEHQQNMKDEAVRTDPSTKQDLIDRMFSADKPATEIEILRAEVNGKLSHTDSATLRQLNKAMEEEPLKGPVWHDTMDAAKSQLVVNIPGIPGKDERGISNYAKFAQTFIPDYLAKKRAGTLDANALDVNDPNSMISKAMSPFKRTMSQRMSDYMAASSGAANAAATPAPVETAPALPPTADRKAGNTYPTARGPMKWTGTGWVSP